jgi:hypothetical protein
MDAGGETDIFKCGPPIVAEEDTRRIGATRENIEKAIMIEIREDGM